MIYFPPQNISKRDFLKKSVFLAGSIEMNNAEDWQTELSKWFVERNFNVFNPRRPQWDSSWVQEFDNSNFYQQVSWELNSLEKADLIILNLIPDTKSPISLLELGLYAKSNKIMVVCPDGFWRKGNVEVVCNQYNIPLFDNIEELKKQITL